MHKARKSAHSTDMDSELLPITGETRMITTTLNRIRAHSPCEDGWTKLLKHLGKSQADDGPQPVPQPVPLLLITFVG